MPAEDPERLGEESRESFDKLRDLVDEPKIVQEHKDSILEDKRPSADSN
jgi:hypothetical protein